MDWQLIRITITMRNLGLLAIIMAVVLTGCTATKGLEGRSIRANRNIVLRLDTVYRTRFDFSPGYRVYPRGHYDSVILYFGIQTTSDVITPNAPFVLISPDSGILADHFSYNENGHAIIDSFYAARRPLQYYYWGMLHRQIAVSWNQTMNCKTHFRADGTILRKSCYSENGILKNQTVYANANAISTERGSMYYYLNGVKTNWNEGEERRFYNSIGIAERIEIDTLVQNRELRHVLRFHNNGVLAEDAYFYRDTPCLYRACYSSDGKLKRLKYLPKPDNIQKAGVYVTATSGPYKFVRLEASAIEFEPRFQLLLDSFLKASNVMLRGKYVLNFRVNERGEQIIDSLYGINARASIETLRAIFNSHYELDRPHIRWKPAKWQGMPVTTHHQLQFSAHLRNASK